MAKSDAAEETHDRDAAEARGKRTALAEMLTWLEQRFMDPKVSIDSVRAHAISALAGELAREFRDQAESRESAP